MQNFAQTETQLSRLASRRQRLLNCAAWNAEQAKKAEQQKDPKRAERLWEQARGLYEQAEEM